jgi:hypothetical protein
VLDAGTTAVVACGRSQVWAAVPSGAGDDVYTSAPGGPWSKRGSLPRHAVSLVVDGDDHAFVATGSPAALLSVTLQPSLNASTIRLPGWVDTVGGPAMRN